MARLDKPKANKMTIHAVDIDEDMLAQVRNTARDSMIANRADVRCHQRDCFDETGSLKDIIADNSVGLAVLSSILHCPDAAKISMLNDVERMLAPGGRVLLTHWVPGFQGRVALIRRK